MKNILKVLSLVLAFTALAPAISVAQASELEDYFTVGTVEVMEMDDQGAIIAHSVGTNPPSKGKTPAPAPKPGDTASPTPPATGNVEIGELVNLGKQIWQIILENQPVVNVSTDTANVVPQGVEGWMTLQGWSAPKAKNYRILYRNLMGVDVVDFSYRVLYTYNGNYRGKGRFLANVTIIPANLSVAWGYKFNATATVPSITNAGAENDPIGAAELLIKWDVSTPLKYQQSSVSYYVRGDGYFEAL